MDLKLIFIFSYIAVVTADEEDWTKKCNKCTCIWANGKKTANCADLNFNTIPHDLSGAIREIDFSNNQLNALRKEEFYKANLSNIHKLKLQNCSLELVDERSFSHLALMIELDLSRNRIQNLQRNIFRENVKLRVLILTENMIEVLEDGLFYNFTFLQKIHLDHNLLTSVTPNTFQKLPSLTHINLAYNKIQTINFDLKNSLTKLNSLSVDGNPWVCDCHLEVFRKSVIQNTLITTKTLCQNPPMLQGRNFQESVVFACPPVILEPTGMPKINADSDNITLVCKVSGDPAPDVDWVNMGQIIERDPRKNKQKYYTSKDTLGGYTWNNLTITKISYRDRGEYKCIAKNPGGEDIQNVTVAVVLGASVGGIAAVNYNLYMIIGIILGLLVVVLVFVLLMFCYCRRNSHGLGAKRREHADSSEEYINMSGGPGDIKKGLITDVNPISKPPRTTVSPSVVSGGTEVSDVNRKLLDNDSVFDCDEETRSLDFDQPLLRKSQLTLDSDYRLNGHHYPPDLLPFPPRGASQVSPAASSASTVADTSRLPPHHAPQSPLQSPIYDQLSLYRTLPYSRTHSPFAGPAAPRIPRQGYVTIPRRPRQSSWSSEPPNVSELASVAEPLYDNLGRRTSASGGTSTPSLNKIDGAITSTPRTNRMFPLSVNNCDPIAETHETSPSAGALTTGSQTLPRNLNSTKLTPSRTQWARTNAEALQSPEKRNSTASLPSPDHPGSKPTKIPPRPPPKPKKRMSTGPLFEDEGEDGTEV